MQLQRLELQGVHYAAQTERVLVGALADLCSNTCEEECRVGLWLFCSTSLQIRVLGSQTYKFTVMQETMPVLFLVPPRACALCKFSLPYLLCDFCISPGRL